MKITSITKFKHGELFAVLRRLKWSQVDLARESGVSRYWIGQIINLHARPTAETANAIQEALGRAGEYLDVLNLWPEAFVGLRPGYRYEQTTDIPFHVLLDSPEVLRLAAPDSGMVEERRELAETLMTKLGEREQRIIEARHFDNRTYEQISQLLRRKGVWITSNRVRQIEQNALRKLRWTKEIQEIRKDVSKQNKDHAEYADNETMSDFTRREAVFGLVQKCEVCGMMRPAYAVSEDAAKTVCSKTCLDAMPGPEEDVPRQS